MAVKNEEQEGLLTDLEATVRTYELHYGGRGRIDRGFEGQVVP